MIDRERVVKGLEQFKADFKPFCGNGSDWARVDDAINLLKEQEAILVDTKVIGTFNGDTEVYCCRDCRTTLDPAFHYCPSCGQEVKWNDI